MKNRLFTMRVSDEERQQLKALAAASGDDGMSLADLIRQCLQTATVGRRPPRQQRTEVVASPLIVLAVSKCGSNLNQLARHANRFQSAANAVQIIAALIAIERQLSAALEDARQKRQD